MKRFSSSLTAFTLVELLITTSILSLVIFTVYGVYASGINIWNRAKNSYVEEARIYILIERFQTDLRNMVFVSNLGFQGSANSLSFPFLVEQSKLGLLEYRFDPERKQIFKIFKDYSKVFSKASGKVLKSIPCDDLKFGYYFFDPKLEVFIWMDNFQKETEFPLAVEIKIISKGREFSKKIWIMQKI